MEDEEEVVQQDEEGMDIIHVNSSSNTSPEAEMQEINDEEEVIEISDDNSNDDRAIQVVMEIVVEIVLDI